MILLIKVFKDLKSYINKHAQIDKDIEFYLNSNYKISPYLESIRISFIYGLAGVFWIVLSDKLLRKITPDIDTYIELATYKGWVYVVITMLLIYSLIVKRLILFKKSLKKISDNFEQLNATNQELIALEEELREQFEELERHRNALVMSEQRYELAVEGADCGIWDWDIENNIYYFSPKWKSYLGYKENEVGNTFEDLVELIYLEDKNDAILKINDYISSNSNSYEDIYRMICKNGDYKWILSKAKAIRNDEGKVIRVAGSHTDITEHKLIRDRLNTLAYYDVLTGLPNRFLFQEKINEIISAYKKEILDRKFALIYMDIDNFKHINDTMGHASGDLLLKHISNILKIHVKSPDFAARLSGDEFVIIFENIKDRQDIINKIHILLKHLREPWILDKQEFFISFSIGIAIYPEHGDNISTLLKNSDIAMYYVKKNTKNNYCFYLSKMQEKSLEQIKIVNDLRHAIDNNEFSLFYQPIINLNNGKITGVEALIRWFHPISGMVSPMEFIPLAEEAGLIYDIEKWILKTALTQKRCWEKMGYSHIKMSINISGKRVTSSGFINEIKKLLSETKVKCDEIQFEVTETALMEDLDASMKILREIKNMNIKIALDDFGTGYSSLTYLKKLPIDVVKLDRKFIKSISEAGEDEVIVEYVIKLTHKLNLKIVAEGIEIKEQLAFLKKNYCDYGQGYLFSKPIAKEEIEKLLLSNKSYE